MKCHFPHWPRHQICLFSHQLILKSRPAASMMTGRCFCGTKNITFTRPLFSVPVVNTRFIIWGIGRIEVCMEKIGSHLLCWVWGPPLGAAIRSYSGDPFGNLWGEGREEEQSFIVDCSEYCNTSTLVMHDRYNQSQHSDFRGWGSVHCDREESFQSKVSRV